MKKQQNKPPVQKPALKEPIGKNLEFWESVEQTDPQYTKPVDDYGQNYTSIDAQYRKRLITEKFGMYGKGWGIVTDSEVYERVEYKANQTVMLIYKATAFYVQTGRKYYFPIAASAIEASFTKQGAGYYRIDDETVKKVRTGALMKGFTELGFNADVYMGKFDDQNYRESTAAAFEFDKAEDSEQSIKDEKEKMFKWVHDKIESAKVLLPKSPSGFKGAMASTRKNLITKCSALRLNSEPYTNKFDLREKELLEEVNNKGQK